MIPGEIVTAGETITLNDGAEAITLVVALLYQRFALRRDLEGAGAGV